MNKSNFDSEDDITGEESEPEINPVYEYNYSAKEERFVGYKPSFLPAVEELKKTFTKKENNIMMINDYEILIKRLQESKVWGRN